MYKKLLLSFSFFFFFAFVINAQISFTESASSLGVTSSYGGTDILTGGVSFCDFDGDGWDDLTFSTTFGSSLRFFKNNSGAFTEISIPEIAISNNNNTLQVTWIDYDNDGDKDLFISTHDAQNKLYQNNGSFSFTDVTTSAGFDTTSLNTFGNSWGDYNNDGYLDVFISYRDGFDNVTTPFFTNTLYQNNGDGTFTDVSASAGLDVTDGHFTFCSVFFDYDNDGWQDIYISNDKPSNNNIMYHNNGDGTFTDTSVSTGTNIGIDAMSTTVGDYDNDGYLDLYVTNSFDGNVFLKNNGDGTFTDVATSTGTLMESWAWGAVFLDADNDMDTDLYVSAMIETPPHIVLPSAFYENQGDDTFSIPSSAGFDNDMDISFSNAIGDIDNDGYPDIVVVNRESNNFVFQNNGTTNNYLKVKLQGTTSNRDGIGSWIQAYNDGVPQNRYTLAGEGFISQNSNHEFFGLGNETLVDSLKITWLSGVVDILYDVPVNQSLTIIEGSSLSVDNFNQSTFNVYPNPSDYGKYQIKFSYFDRSEKFDLTVFDTLGRELISRKLNSQEDQVDISKYKAGIYFLQISTGTKSVVKKLIKN